MYVCKLRKWKHKLHMFPSILSNLYVVSYKLYMRMRCLEQTRLLRIRAKRCHQTSWNQMSRSLFVAQICQCDFFYACFFPSFFVSFFACLLTCDFVALFCRNMTVCFPLTFRLRPTMSIYIGWCHPRRQLSVDYPFLTQAKGLEDLLRVNGSQTLQVVSGRVHMLSQTQDVDRMEYIPLDFVQSIFHVVYLYTIYMM